VKEAIRTLASAPGPKALSISPRRGGREKARRRSPRRRRCNFWSERAFVRQGKDGADFTLQPQRKRRRRRRGRSGARTSLSPALEFGARDKKLRTLVNRRRRRRHAINFVAGHTPTKGQLQRTDMASTKDAKAKPPRLTVPEVVVELVTDRFSKRLMALE